MIRMNERYGGLQGVAASTQPARDAHDMMQFLKIMGRNLRPKKVTIEWIEIVAATFAASVATYPPISSWLPAVVRPYLRARLR